MLVTDDAKYCSRRSKVDLAAMSDRGGQKEASKQEPTSVTSRAKQPVIKNSFDMKGQPSKAVRRREYPTDAATAPVVIDADRRRRAYPIDAATCTAPVVIDVDWRRRAYPIDAATCTVPVVIDAEGSMAGIRRETPLINAATMSTSGKEGHCDTRANSDDELTSVSDVPEMTAEEELLREVGLNDPS